MTSDHARALEDLLVVEKPEGGGTVVLHVPTSTYLELDESASLIVTLLTDARSEDGAARALAARAKIPLRQAQDDIRSVLSALAEHADPPRRHGHPSRRPPLGNALAEGRRWWRLPPAVRWRVVWVTLVLIAVEVGLRTVDVRRLAVMARVPLAESQGHGPLPPVPANALNQRELCTLRALKWVSYRWIYPVTCLRWALVAGFFLHPRRPVLRLGLLDDGVTAHAWIEFDGSSLGGVDVSGVFSQRARLDSERRRRLEAPTAGP